MSAIRQRSRNSRSHLPLDDGEFGRLRLHTANTLGTGPSVRVRPAHLRGYAWLPKSYWRSRPARDFCPLGSRPSKRVRLSLSRLSQVRLDPQTGNDLHRLEAVWPESKCEPFQNPLPHQTDAVGREAFGEGSPCSLECADHRSCARRLRQPAATKPNQFLESAPN
jgi:hypothetical protein